MDDRVQALVEKDAVAAKVTELFVATDERDWERVVECFAPQVLFDVTSMGGPEPSMIDAADIAHMWSTGLAPIRAVHHQIGNLRVTLSGREADAACYGIAYHYLPNSTGDNTRVFVGSYDLHLSLIDDRWRIDAFRFNLKFVDGNEELEHSV